MVSESFEKASNWVLNSGIQNKSGAFHAWVDLENGRKAFEYSEITGYGISALVFLNSVKNSPELLEKAGKASEWLLRNAVTAEGAVLARNYMDWEAPDPNFSFEGRNCFSFDAGMVLNGLMALYESGKDKSCLEAASKVGNYLLERVGAGRMEAVYNVKEGKSVNSGEKWSWQPGPYHAKVSIGLLKLAKAKGESYREAALDLCDFALKRQMKPGRFVTNSGDESTHLHPHCYSAEGLLFAGIGQKEGRYIDAAERAVLWALENQAVDGGIRAFFCGDWNQSQRSDVLAQVLRLAAVLKSLGRLNSVEDEKISLLERRLLQFQHESGGFLYGKELDMASRPCVNAWCTMFALQALKWRQAEEIGYRQVV
jgi:hypothetical protein